MPRRSPPALPAHHQRRKVLDDNRSLLHPTRARDPTSGVGHARVPPRQMVSERTPVVTPVVTQVVTIDGPAGAGKSTTARQLATRLGYSFLDTGALYRTVALMARRRDVDWSD